MEKQRIKALLSKLIDCLAMKFNIDRAFVDEFIHTEPTHFLVNSFLEDVSKSVQPAAPHLFFAAHLVYKRKVKHEMFRSPKNSWIPSD